MARPPRARPVPLPAISRLVRETTAATGAAGNAADLGHRLVRTPVGILVRDGRDDPIVAISPKSA
jgi:hypothetical protein